VAGLELLAERGDRFGERLIWNYGPLGFLHAGPLLYFSDLAIAAFAYHWALQLLLAATLYVAARRSYPWPVAFAIAFAALTLVVDRALLLGFAWCVLALTRGDDPPRDAAARWFPAAIGALAGVLVLSKINQGAEIVALAVVTLATRPGRRPLDAVAFAGMLLATASAGWLLTGQTLADVWPYVRYGFETVGGYPATAGAANPDGQWHYLAALALFALGSALVWRTAREAGRVRRWGLVTVWLLFSFAAFKQGFIRHGDGHVRLFLTAMLVALAVLPAGAAWRWRTVAGAGIAACVVLYGVVAADLGERLDPVDNAREAVAQAATLASPARRARERGELVGAIRGHYLPPPAIADRLPGRTVAFWPFASGDLAFALGVDWRPLPVMEPYGVSTPKLDEVTAAMLASSRAPELIVRRPRIGGPVDPTPSDPPREVMFGTPLDPPLTTRTLLCRYREVVRAGHWQLLARGPDRCGSPRPVASAVAGWGEQVAVPRPRPGTALLVRIDGAGVAGVERLKALWLRPDARVAVLDGRSYRLVPSTAHGGLLLRAAPGADHGAPLALAPGASTIAIHRTGDPQPGGELRYTFLELPVGEGG
jgi:hypothetical protein